MIVWRSMRWTWLSVPDRANRVPNTQNRASAGVPPTMGTGRSDRCRRAISTARPMLPMPGALSKVEHAL